MIFSYPEVNDDGQLSGGDVSFRFKDITALQKMHTCNYSLENVDDRVSINPECTTVYLARSTFNIKVPYAEMLALFKQQYELYE